jgi:hypothetical protein
MFVRKDYRDRAVGLVAAFVVLGVGIKVTGAMATPRSAEPRVIYAGELVNEPGASDCSLAHRPEMTVPFC